jgi:hypothetical protein
VTTKPAEGRGGLWGRTGQGSGLQSDGPERSPSAALSQRARGSTVGDAASRHPPVASWRRVGEEAMRGAGEGDSDVIIRGARG